MNITHSKEINQKTQEFLEELNSPKEKNMEPMKMTFCEALRYLHAQGKSYRAISRALNFKNDMYGNYAVHRGIQTPRDIEIILKMFQLYNILIKPYTSEAEILSELEWRKKKNNDTL